MEQLKQQNFILSSERQKHKAKSFVPSSKRFDPYLAFSFWLFLGLRKGNTCLRVFLSLSLPLCPSLYSLFPLPPCPCLVLTCSLTFPLCLPSLVLDCSLALFPSHPLTHCSPWLPPSLPLSLPLHSLTPLTWCTSITLFIRTAVLVEWSLLQMASSSLDHLQRPCLQVGFHL